MEHFWRSCGGPKCYWLCHGNYFIQEHDGWNQHVPLISSGIRLIHLSLTSFYQFFFFRMVDKNKQNLRWLKQGLEELDFSFDWFKCLCSLHFKVEDIFLVIFVWFDTLCYFFVLQFPLTPFDDGFHLYQFIGLSSFHACFLKLLHFNRKRLSLIKI